MKRRSDNYNCVLENFDGKGKNKCILTLFHNTKLKTIYLIQKKLLTNKLIYTKVSNAYTEILPAHAKFSLSFLRKTTNIFDCKKKKKNYNNTYH